MSNSFLFVFILFFNVQNSFAQAEDTRLLARIEKQITASYEDRVQLSIEKAQLETQISDVQKKIKDKKILLLKRLKALHSLKNYKWGELLLNTNFNSLERNIRILKNLNKYDYELFKDYNLSLKLLAVSRKNLQETEELIKQNVESLKIKQLEFQKLEAVRIADLTKSKKASLLVFKGLLARPLEGRITQEFGSVRDQENQFYLVNHGELYSSKTSTPVKTVGPGTIIFRDGLLRWRETLIVQHDDNYYTVYAGLKNLKKSVGDKVVKNEQIGITSGADFYFELRHFDNPINPKTWYYKE